MKRVVFLLLILLLVSACQRLPFQRKDTMKLPEVNIGTQGVELYLTRGTPPPEVYEGSPFSLLVTLSNLGTFDVEEGVYSISYEKQYLYLSQQQALGRFRVRGKSTFYPQGAEQLVQLVFTTKQLGTQMERYPATITFNACYPYTTTAPLPVCIDTDITGKVKKKACTPQTQAFPRGQGAPVAVTNIEPRMRPHEDLRRIVPEFILTLRNLGSGEAVAEQLYREACSDEPLGEEGWNTVHVQAALSDIPLTCTPSPVKLKRIAETRVVCRLQEGVDPRLGTYTDLLTVKLGYGYLTSITSQVNIIKPPM